MPKYKLHKTTKITPQIIDQVAVLHGRRLDSWEIGRRVGIPGQVVRVIIRTRLNGSNLYTGKRKTERGNNYPENVNKEGKFGAYKQKPTAFHKWARQYRIELALSYQGLSRRWGVFIRTIWNWMHFISIPTWESLYRIYRVEKSINPAFDPRVFFEYPYEGPNHERHVRDDDLRKPPEWIPHREVDPDYAVGDAGGD